MPPSQLLLLTTALTTATAGLLAIALGLFRDRARGRPRCPRCWYDLRGQAASTEALLPCPKCGHTPKSPRHLQRTRRHYRPVLVGLLLLIAGGIFAGREALLGVNLWPRVPTTTMIRLLPYASHLPKEYADELERRIWPIDDSFLKLTLNSVNWSPGWTEVEQTFDHLTASQKALLGHTVLRITRDDPLHPLADKLWMCLSLCEGADAEAAEPMLASALKDPTALGRAKAAAALGRLDGHRAVIARDLIAALNASLTPGESGPSRAWGARGVQTQELAANIHGYSQTEADWRVEAIKALGHCGPAAAGAVPVLIEHLDNAFILWPSPSQREALADRQMKIAVCRTLGEIGPAASSTRQRLRDVAYEERPEVEACIAEQFVTGAAKSRDDALRILASHADPTVRRAAIIEIGNIRPLTDPWAKVLVAKLSDKDADVQIEAAETLLTKGVQREACQTALSSARAGPEESDARIRVRLMWRYGLDPTPLLPTLEQDAQRTTIPVIRSDLERMIVEVKAGRRHADGKL